MNLIGKQQSGRGGARIWASVALTVALMVGGGLACPNNPPPGGCPAGCPTGFTCVGTACQANCASGCPTGQNCQNGQCQPNGTGGCTPACSPYYACSGTKCILDGGVPALACSAPTLVASSVVAGPPSAPGGCVTPVGTSALPAGQIQAFGAQQVGTNLAFTVPASTASISIVSQLIGDAGATIDLQGSVLGNVVVPLNVTGPTGTTLYDDSVNAPADLSTSPIVYQSYSPTMGMMTVPNSSTMLAQSSAGLPAGIWHFTVSDYANECLTISNCDGGTNTNVYDVAVIAKPGTPPTSGTVDVAFYLVETGGLTAATAVTDPAVVRMVETLDRLYSQAGICLGTVTFYDVQPWAQNEYATHIDADKIEACDNLNQMFTLSVPSTNAINFFLVEQITSTGGGGQVEGIDGTIPGPSSYGGIIHSGAAVSAANLQLGSGTAACQGGINLTSCGADITAYIAAHEGGHWMGLYHTTEGHGTAFDAFNDTETCECKTCVTDATQCEGATPAPSTPVFVNVSNCTAGTNVCGGGENLMFWLLDQQRSIGKLSPQQGQVIRDNLVVH